MIIIIIIIITMIMITINYYRKIHTNRSDIYVADWFTIFEAMISQTL
jgi:hypothetical protein